MREAPNRSLHVIVHGGLDRLTGGHRYDRAMVEGLTAAGWTVQPIGLPGRFPDADQTATEAGQAALAALPERATVVFDGVTLAALAPGFARHLRRLTLVGLIHHPLGQEPDLAPESRTRLAALEADWLPRLGAIICPSPAMARALSGIGVSPARISVVRPGMERLGAGNPAAVRSSSRSGPVRLLSVGSLTPRKGHEVLVEALAPLAGLDWTLTIIGGRQHDPTAAAALVETIARAGLSQRVDLAGEIPHQELGPWYQAADLFVLASRYEGYGMVFTEAMAHGLPILSCRAGAIPETVPPAAGLLVPPGDRAALSAALTQLIQDPDLRQRLGAGARAAALSLPDWATQVGLFAEALGRIGHDVGAGEAGSQ